MLPPPAGQTLKEAQFINRSLSFLEQTVNALSRKDAYVPYRQTKLTAVLRDALGGNCKTVMVANVWGELGGRVTFLPRDPALSSPLVVVAPRPALCCFASYHPQASSSTPRRC